MNRFLKIAAGIALLAAAFSCCNCRSFQKKNRRPLVGTEWQLVQLGGRSITPEEGKYTVVLSDDERISGVGACNRLMGGYTLGGKNALRFGALASTRMACPGMETEAEFMQMFDSVVRYDMDGPMLLLLGADDDLLAVFQAKPAAGSETEAARE